MVGEYFRRRGVTAFWYLGGGESLSKLMNSLRRVGVKLRPSSYLMGDRPLRSTNAALIVSAAARIVVDTIGFLRRLRKLPSISKSVLLYIEKKDLKMSCRSVSATPSRNGLTTPSRSSSQNFDQRRQTRSWCSFVDSWTESKMILAFASLA